MERSILIVDDDAEIRLMLAMLMEMEGWRVTEAQDGLDALRKLETQQPDAIVLDVMMPNMDGLTFCQSLRRKPETAETPIIMLSGKPTLAAMKEGLRAGATIYLTKPPDLDELLRHLNQLTQSLRPPGLQNGRNGID
jgi:DNA-binding response OmpR family regulator